MRTVLAYPAWFVGAAAMVFFTLTGFVHADEQAAEQLGVTSSPSGEYTLRVEARDDYLRTSARYTLMSKGKEVWSGEKPYTLREMTVTDDGRVAGLAYRVAARRSPDGRNRKQYLHVVILDRTGKEILNDVVERKPGPKVDAGYVQYVPFAEQILVDPDNDRVIVRGRDDDTPGDIRLDFWWIYRLSTGETLKRFRPVTGLFDLMPVYRTVRIGLVPGTDLVLIHWFLSVGGARFTLVAPEGNEVWSLDLEDDYAALPETTRSDLRPFLTRNPAVLSLGPQGRFELRFFASNQRVTFAAVQIGANLWDVREVSRADYVQPEPTTVDK